MDVRRVCCCSEPTSCFAITRGPVCTNPTSNPTNPALLQPYTHGTQVAAFHTTVRTYREGTPFSDFDNTDEFFGVVGVALGTTPVIPSSAIDARYGQYASFGIVTSGSTVPTDVPGVYAQAFFGGDNSGATNTLRCVPEIAASSPLRAGFRFRFRSQLDSATYCTDYTQTFLPGTPFESTVRTIETGVSAALSFAWSNTATTTFANGDPTVTNGTEVTCVLTQIDPVPTLLDGSDGGIDCGGPDAILLGLTLPVEDSGAPITDPNLLAIERAMPKPCEGCG